MKPHLFSLFHSFFKIGTFTIGGGLAMLPLMQNELVEKHHWLDENSFLDLVALSQAMPGVFAVNMATAVGYRLRGIFGAICSVLGTIVMPVAIIILIAFFARQFRGNRLVEAIFMGLRPAVVALIAVPVFTMAKAAEITWSNVWIPLVAAGLIWLCGVSPIWIILVAFLAGWLFYHKIHK